MGPPVLELTGQMGFDLTRVRTALVGNGHLNKLEVAELHFFYVTGTFEFRFNHGVPI